MCWCRNVYQYIILLDQDMFDGLVDEAEQDVHILDIGCNAGVRRGAETEVCRWGTLSPVFVDS